MCKLVIHFIYLFITYASFIHLTPGMFTVLDKIHPIMPPFLHEWHFLLVAFRIYQPQPSSASLFFLLLPSGKWLMPITGRGGSPTTRTGSSAKTPASSTWNIHWTCGSTRSGRVHRIVIADKKAVTYAQWGVRQKHVNDLKKTSVCMDCRAEGWPRCPATLSRFCEAATRSSIHGNIL